MSLRFRRSVKLIPGVKLNCNKNSLSLTFGPKGAHYTLSSNGNRLVSAGIPGTGLYGSKYLGNKTVLTAG